MCSNLLTRSVCRRISSPASRGIFADVRAFSSDTTDPRANVKRFNPSLGQSGETVITTEKINISKPRNVEDIIIETRQAREEANMKVRKLHIWDKWILVKLGKYKQISEVPDELVFSETKASKEVQDKIRAEMMEKGFKGFVSMDYIGWFICFGLCGSAYYAYRKSLPSDKAVENDLSIGVSKP